MNEKNRVHLPKHQTILNQILLKQLVRSPVPNVSSASAAMSARMVDYEKLMRAVPTAASRALESYEKQMRNPSAAMSARVMDYEKLMRAVPTAASRALESYEKQMRNPSAAMSARVMDYEKLMRAVPTAASRALESYEKQMRNPSAVMSARVMDYEKLMRAVPTAASRALESYEKQMRNPSAVMSACVVDNEKQMRNLSATIARAAETDQYWQKQTSLGFPNIIRGGVSANPSRISTPEQHRTPLLEPSPTAITDEVYEEISPEIIPAPSPELVPVTNRKSVFIVHGHDHETRDNVSKFVSNWGLTATVLDEQPNKGRTIIEKFEDCADEASFAIILLTPDDVGASVKDKAHLKYRARQNVIFEWGYFSGSIGRKRVCILYKGNLELPSDTQGVVYVRMDDNDEWKQSIVREMEAVGLLIDANKI